MKKKTKHAVNTIKITKNVTKTVKGEKGLPSLSDASGVGKSEVGSGVAIGFSVGFALGLEVGVGVGIGVGLDAGSGVSVSVSMFSFEMSTSDISG